MENVVNLLPYAILLLAAVISFFLKGNNVNKILCLVVFAVAMFCVCAESGWWRLSFIVVTGLLCKSQTNNSHQGIPCFLAMGLGITLLIIAKWVICSVLSRLFGYLNPTWVLVIISLFFSWMLLGNVRYE